MENEEIKTGGQPEKIKHTKKQLLAEIFRFLLVGGLATIADYIVFYLFRQWLLPTQLFDAKAWDICSLIIATAFGFCAGLVVNWILSVKFVFRAVKNTEEAHSKKGFLIFTVIGLIGLGITELGMLVLVRVFPAITLFGTTQFLLPWDEWLAKIIMTCIVLVFNYIGRKIFVFK